MSEKVALITGAAKRVGAVIAKTLHSHEMKIIIHYHHSETAAQQLCDELNDTRPSSAHTIRGDVTRSEDCRNIIAAAQAHWGRLDALINNASSFYPSPLGQIDENVYEDLMGSNLKGPLFLAQAAIPFLEQTHGNIINITDIHAERPLKNYTVYCCAKAALVMLTKSLARDLAPKIRVNAVAPGAILWPNDDNDLSEKAKDYILGRIPLKRKGDPQDIANTVLFLLNQEYITGQIIAVDGGRSIRD